MLTMNTYIAKIVGLIIIFIVSPIVQAQNLITRDEDWTAINIAVTDELIIPAYQNLESFSVQLISSAESFCSDLNSQNLDNLKNSYQASMLAWQKIQHVQFGPITYFNWNYRMQYWPDERGASGRQLDALIAAQDVEILESSAFPRQSVGVQGLPALERILYGENALNNFQNNPYLCSLTETIARNINEIGSGVTQRWVDEYRSLVLDPVTVGFYEDAEDLSIDFLKALQEAIAKIRDLKLAPALGESFATARTRSAESWRSVSSLANIKNNLDSLALLYAAYSPAFHAEDSAVINQGFADLNVTLDSLPDSLVSAIEDESQYVELKVLHSQVEALHEALETALKNTDLYLGFNSLDGD